MLRKSIQALSCTLLLIATATLCHAQISVNRSVIEFTKVQKIQDIEVLNTGDSKVYLDLKASEILNPESDNATRVDMNDPRTSALIVSPRQLLVPPGERRRFRVILRQPAIERDRVFRLAVKPYTGSVKIDDDGKDKKSSAIKVLVGYDLLLLSRPDRLNPQLEVVRNNNSITFQNRGNTNVLLRKIEQCNSAGTDCTEIQPNRLYAGERYSIDLPKIGNANTHPVHVWTAVGLENKTVSY